MCYKYRVFGAVQGVGFRPFVYKLALELDLKGEVYNDSEGVKITLLGDESKISSFEKALVSNLPPLARIDKIEKEKTLATTNYENFSIIPSKQTTKSNPILPDFAICDDCKTEFYDEKSRFFHYPFINCTNCGPRFSIIKSLPYDRVNTTMSKFNMCEVCQSEYTNPLNRRFHAQPISCPKCGVTLSLKDKNAKVLESGNFNSIIKKTANLLKEGNIFAIKGIGGFHLVCDAFNESVINRLRELKHRPKKPFAIMCRDLEMAKSLAKISKKEEEILTSSIKPIVILELKKEANVLLDNIPPNLAPNLNKIGIFLAPTGLHLALFEEFKNPIIATSGNLSGEPIIKDEVTLYSKLNGVFDYCLDNDREILNPSDDSIVQIINEKPFYLRTSRGINPVILPTSFETKGCFLAIGAELKNQFAIYKDSQIYISPYIGDIKSVANFERFLSILELFVKSYDMKFDAIIADKHPNFLHTKHFKNYKIYRIQHHYAHLMATLYEHNLPNKTYLGFCFDGTGYGDDGKVWGGEVFKFNHKSYERVYHFDEFKMLGGDKSVKEIYRLTYAILKKYNLDTKCLNLDENLEKNLSLMYEKNLNTFETSSIGRIFDAFYALKFDQKTISYEGEAGMVMESLYDKFIDDYYKFDIIGDKICYKNAFEEALKDKPSLAVTKFINGLANLIIQISLKERLPVVLSGGVFQNKTLNEALIKKFDKSQIEYYFSQKTPINDSGIAVGQLFWFLSNFKLGEKYV
ncbi:MAG: carbamoyltransferase HypF [Campylobacteraceae bacterium]|nr:carbamoyltransferase HypF [Campylobacteraceae bacterium]